MDCLRPRFSRTDTGSWILTERTREHPEIVLPDTEELDSPERMIRRQFNDSR
jgi:hypothetical protein